jgi:DNA mismatch repair protein MutS2
MSNHAGELRCTRDTSTVDARSLQVLEFDRVVELVAEATAFEGGRALALALAPSADPGRVRHLQEETTEALALLERDPPRLAGAHDVRSPAELALRGGLLRPDALAAIAETGRCAVDVRRKINERDDLPKLRGVASAIAPGLELLAGRIEHAIEADGSGVRDDASPALRRLRREIASARARSVERLRNLATTMGPHLQEDFVTERGGRPVLAVRASARGAVPGIVHDTSGSGQTLFVEPFALVEAQNAIRELEAGERDEVERILAELSAQVRAHAHDLIATVAALAHLDLSLARGAVSHTWGGCSVQIADHVELVEARHPLLDPVTAVPIDLPLRGVRAVVISGPNTGGKTVGLKTLGLLALAHQAGLRPPARSARLPVFDTVLADIGDEQSIAMSLSTFSGHVRNLVRIEEAAGQRSLVLLDEIAAGTDPHEGAALARAYLASLVGHGALVLATTHYPELKEWASATDGVVNGSVGFDPDTLAPTYVVILGRPGASHAIQIAQRLGLSPTVVAAARAEVEPARLAVADLLAEAATAERAATGARAAAERARQQMEGALADVARRERELGEAIATVRAGAQAERERARVEAERDLGAYRRELEALRAEIREARRAPSEPDRDRRLGAADQGVRRAADVLATALAAPDVPMQGPLAIGDPVIAPSLGVRGTIVAIEDGQAEVHGGTLRIRVDVDRLRPDPNGARRTLEPEQPVVVRAAAASSVAYSIDVRGKTSDEAREEVRRFIDSAHFAGSREVEVIHGRGTGAVRKAVRDELARHPMVEESLSASADGATRVRIAQD